MLENQDRVSSDVVDQQVENEAVSEPEDLFEESAGVADAVEETDPTVPYDLSQPTDISENEADSESSETDSSMKTPPRRQGNRERKPRAIFAYNELGNPTILR